MDAPQHLRIDDAVCPVGVDGAAPAFSWRLARSDERDQGQSAYRVLVATGAELLDGADVWEQVAERYPWAVEGLLRYSAQQAVRTRGGG